MPLGSSQFVAADPAFQSESRGMPVLRVRGLQIRLAYSVLIATVILAAFALIASGWPGNANMRTVVTLGTLFWLSGWIAQGVTYLLVSHWLGIPTAELCLGVLGVEAGPRRWQPTRACLVILATLTSLIALASLYYLAAGGMSMPQIIRSDASFWIAPSLGLAEHDSIWETAGWLCCVQGVLQLYPLPRTLGRHLFGALTAICWGSLELPAQVAIVRRYLRAISLLTMAMTIWLVMAEQPFLGTSWILYLGLAIAVWISSSNQNIERCMAGLKLGQQLASVQPEAPDVVEEVRGRFRQWRSRRRLRTAQRLEWGEAVDAKRVDEILSRLHQQGGDALNAEDRRILERVSASLRRQRADTPPEDPPTE